MMVIAGAWPASAANIAPWPTSPSDRLVTALLTDGRTVVGRWFARTGAWASRETEAGRYGAWRDSTPELFAPALGETLIAGLLNGDAVRGRFVGTALDAILFDTADSCRLTVLPLSGISGIRLASMEETPEWGVLRERLRGAPQADALLLGDMLGVWAIPARCVVHEARTDASPRNGSAAGTVVLVVVLAAVVAYLAAGFAVASIFGSFGR